jgi:hypothetical protein
VKSCTDKVFPSDQTLVLGPSGVDLFCSTPAQYNNNVLSGDKLLNSIIVDEYYLMNDRALPSHLHLSQKRGCCRGAMTSILEI